MRSVKRMPLTILAAVSVLMLSAVGVMWVRSYWVGDRFKHADLDAERLFAVMSSRGWIVLVRVDLMRPEQHSLDDPAGWAYSREVPAPSLHGGFVRHEDMSWRFFGASYGSRTELTIRLSQLLVPAWAVFAAMLLITMPLLWAWVVLWRRGRRAAPGLCAGCGYDMRGTPERCPECGVAAARAQFIYMQAEPSP